MIVGVIGGALADKKNLDIAYELGKLLAEAGYTVVCGGLSGVMEKACQGAFEAGGMTIGILPGYDTSSANPYVKIPIATGMGLARNYIIINTADILVAVNGRSGTLNEISAAFNMGKKVIAINSWKLKQAGPVEEDLFIEVNTPDEAIEWLKSWEKNGT
ncbi:MAG: TIGR00725 family protein [Spirochaetes bacterium]|nr:TIGR00725 family protein [Spirochaetota bacterium]